MEKRWAFLTDTDDKDNGEFVKRKRMYAIVHSRDLRGKETGKIEYHQSVVLNLYFSMFEYRDIPYFHRIGLIHHSNQFYVYQNPCLQEIHAFGERKRTIIPSLRNACFYKLSTTEVIYAMRRGFEM